MSRMRRKLYPRTDHVRMIRADAAQPGSLLEMERTMLAIIRAMNGRHAEPRRMEADGDRKGS